MSKFLEKYNDGEPLPDYRIHAEIFSPNKVHWTKIRGGAEATVKNRIKCRIDFCEEENKYVLDCIDQKTFTYLREKYKTDIAARYECYAWLKDQLYIKKPCPKDGCLGMINLETTDGVVEVFAPSKDYPDAIWKGYGFDIWECDKCASYYFDLSKHNVNKLPEDDDNITSVPKE